MELDGRYSKKTTEELRRKMTIEELTAGDKTQTPQVYVGVLATPSDLLEAAVDGSAQLVGNLLA